MLGRATPDIAAAGMATVSWVEPVPVVCARHTRDMRLMPEIVESVTAPPLSPHITKVRSLEKAVLAVCEVVVNVVPLAI